ncbi:hypothetical protein Tco_0633377 [Tanacetum coccineum]
MWPIILTTYNLPSRLCMKESYLMSTLLILGPKSLGKDIDVYLSPLIDDLKDLWALKCVETIDVATSQKFNMRAMVLWTINDFHAQSSLSGTNLKDTIRQTRLEKSALTADMVKAQSQDEERLLYEEMLRLKDLGPNTPTGVPYTDGEIMAMVVRSDDKMSQLLTQLQSQHEVGSGSGNDGGGDDEPGEDEDADGDEDS